MSSIYNWTITKDHIEKGKENGLTGPANKSRHTANEAQFRMFDDDGELYYSGSIWGDYDGFEPLDDPVFIYYLHLTIPIFALSWSIPDRFRQGTPALRKASITPSGSPRVFGGSKIQPPSLKRGRLEPP